MNCLHCSKHMYKYYDSDLTPHLKEEIDNHLAVCPFCRFQYDLTLMENEVLRDTSDIPEISLDFNERVMNSITPDMLPHLPNNVLVMSKDTRRLNLRWSSLYTKSAIAVVLLALCFYVPSIFRDDQPARIAQNEQVSMSKQTSALDSVSITGATGSIQQQSKQSIKAPDSDTPTTQPNVNYGNSNSIPPQNKMSSIAPQIYTDSRIAPCVAGRSERKTITPGSLSVSLLSLENIPTKYILVNRDDTNENQIAFSYQTADGAETINIQLIASNSLDQSMAELEDDTASEPLMALSAPAPTENVSREILVEDQKISVNVSGSISKDELNNLANQIVISRNP